MSTRERCSRLSEVRKRSSKRPRLPLDGSSPQQRTHNNENPKRKGTGAPHSGEALFVPQTPTFFQTLHKTINKVQGAATVETHQIWESDGVTARHVSAVHQSKDGFEDGRLPHLHSPEPLGSSHCHRHSPFRKCGCDDGQKRQVHPAAVHHCSFFSLFSTATTPKRADPAFPPAAAAVDESDNPTRHNSNRPRSFFHSRSNNPSTHQKKKAI